VTVTRAEDEHERAALDTPAEELLLRANPLIPSIDDYYEPRTYDHETLTDAPAQEHVPVAQQGTRPVHRGWEGVGARC
jgi:nitrate reductase beta subunit